MSAGKLVPVALIKVTAGCPEAGAVVGDSVICSGAAWEVAAAFRLVSGRIWETSDGCASSRGEGKELALTVRADAFSAEVRGGEGALRSRIELPAAARTAMALKKHKRIRDEAASFMAVGFTILGALR